MNSHWAPGLQAAPIVHHGHPVTPGRAHQKTVRFFRKLSDADVLEFVAALDKTLAISGMAPGPLRHTMMRFAGGCP